MFKEFPLDEVCLITRRKYGRGWQYLDQQGNKLTCPKHLKRIKHLVIPPMWSEVLISNQANSHIQAYGYDLKGRRQYVYHPSWHEQQQKAKFALLEKFAQRLPTIRERYLADCELQDWSEKYVSAVATRVLDETGLRVGNKQYTKKNNTYGLTTLRRKHISKTENELRIEFTGKHNKNRQVEIDDDELIDLIEQCSEQPGYSLFRYKHKGSWHDLSSDELNQYVREVAGKAFSSKFFRTWAGTRLAVECFEDALTIINENKRKTFKTTLIKLVAQILGNTPAICETYYVHPSVLASLIDAQKKGESLSNFLKNSKSYDEHFLDTEKIVLSILHASKT